MYEYSKAYKQKARPEYYFFFRHLTLNIYMDWKMFVYG